MEFHLVESMDDVIPVALDGTIVPFKKLPDEKIATEPPLTH
jgi:hypothetical protein